MKPLVIVRPEPGASATAEAARRMGLEALPIPLFAIRPVDWDAPQPGTFDALLFTSANAIRHGGTRLNRLRAISAHCVGEATAGVARDAGMRVDTVGDAGIEALLARLPPDLKLLHLCGANRRDGVDARQSIVRVPVYDAVELPVPDGFGKIEGTVVAAHSPRAASRLANVVDEAGLTRARIAVAAISDAAAEAAGEGWLAVGTACQPTDAALLSLAAELCNNRG